MLSINELVKKMYEEFVGTPSDHSIVRMNQEGDAFAVAVFNILWSKLELTFSRDNVGEIAKYVIAPPDSGIDIIVPEENEDDTQFSVYQVKYAEESPVEIGQAFSYMKKTIRDFVTKGALSIKSETCRSVLRDVGLNKDNYKNCIYYVVHVGKNHGRITNSDDEVVLNLTDLEIVSTSVKYKVNSEEINIGKKENIMLYESDAGKAGTIKKAYICSVNCYDLAELSEKYDNTVAGRNILFGYNLRESLNPKSSRSYNKMRTTLLKEPENFWYYNNGITIVAETADLKEKSGSYKLIVGQFSIVNGAQTTSTLGRLKSIADRDGGDENAAILSNLKKAHVLVRVVTSQNEEIQHNVAIYNNTQNQINSRDMVANNQEQRVLHDRLLDENYPQIYMEIRRGATVPITFNKSFTHRTTTNENLAQMAFAGFLLQPGVAKDKKSSLFTEDGSVDTLLNEYYEKAFFYEEGNTEKRGILQQKSKNEIDELLFSQYLYKECKNFFRTTYTNYLNDLVESKKVMATEEEKKSADDTISQYATILDTIGICMLFFVATYYKYMSMMGSKYSNKRYDYDMFYSDKKYRMDFVKDASVLFLQETIDILIDTAEEHNKTANMNNWVRGKTCPIEFMAKLGKELTSINKRTSYESFMDKYKTVDI